MKIILHFILGIIFFTTQNLFAQDVPGCTDPQANNFNPEANVNDGSCTYNNTNYSPELLYQLPDGVNETSGLIYYNNSFWTINDSGNPPILYRLDSASGSILQQITVSDGFNVDWEGLAQDEENIFIGDFGNNNGDRTDLGIYIIKKSELPDIGNGQVQSTHISFVYSDYTKQPAKWKETDYDCEAMISVEDSLYLFSKNWIDNQTRLYRLDKTPGEQIAELIYTYNVQGLITDASYNEESNEVSLLGYSQSTFTPFFWLLFDYSENNFFSGNKRRINLASLFGAQTEGIAYTTGKFGVLTNEKNILYPQSAFSYYTGDWTDTTQTGIVQSIFGKQDFVIKPNPVSRGNLKLKLIGFQPGTYSIELYNIKGELQLSTECEQYNEGEDCKLKFSVDSLQPGMYFVRLLSDKIIIEKKFIKK